MKKEIEGKVVHYTNMIPVTTWTKMKFWDAVKMMLGKKLIVYSEVYLHGNKIVATKAAAFVEGFEKNPIPKKKK